MSDIAAQLKALKLHGMAAGYWVAVPLQMGHRVDVE